VNDDSWCDSIDHWLEYEISMYFSIGKQIYDFWFVAHAEEIYTKSLPFEHVKEDIMMLRQAGHEINIISSQPNVLTKIYTLKWLEDYNIEYDSISFTDNKISIDCDVYIDDAPQSINQFNSSGKKIVICDRPWNSICSGTDRVWSFGEFARNIIMEGLYK
jgi:uncharacterized HAD superfamily protein